MEDSDIFFTPEEIKQQEIQKQIQEQELTPEEANQVLSDVAGIVTKRRAYNRTGAFVGVTPAKRARRAAKGKVTSPQGWTPLRRARWNARQKAKHEVQDAPIKTKAPLTNGATAPFPQSPPTGLIAALEELQRNEDQLGLCSNIHPKLYEHAFNLARLALVQMKVIESK